MRCFEQAGKQASLVMKLQCHIDMPAAMCNIYAAKLLLKSPKEFLTLIDIYLLHPAMVCRSCGHGLQHILVLPGICAHACCPFRPGVLLHLSSLSILPVPPQLLCYVLCLSSLKSVYMSAWHSSQARYF